MKYYNKQKNTKRGKKRRSNSSPSVKMGSKKKKDILLLIDVIGTTYTLRIPVDTKEMDDAKADGLCDDIGKDIQIRDLTQDKTMSRKNALLDMKHNIRHELTHAFIKECGLGANDSSEVAWPVSEACIDFFASQFDKLKELFNNGYLLLKELQ